MATAIALTMAMAMAITMAKTIEIIVTAELGFCNGTVINRLFRTHFKFARCRSLFLNWHGVGCITPL